MSYNLEYVDKPGKFDEIVEQDGEFASGCWGCKCRGCSEDILREAHDRRMEEELFGIDRQVFRNNNAIIRGW